MKCFELLATVLDEVWQELPGSTDEKKKAIQAKAAELQKRYAVLDKSSAVVDYRDPSTRYAYLGRYVSSHANIVSRLIKEEPLLSALFNREHVQVACIGGGPGSDLLGILKYIAVSEARATIKCFLYDRERTWGEAWSDLNDKVEADVSWISQPFDVTISEEWQQASKYLKSDLFTMIYFASELYHVRDRAAAFFENLFEKARKGSMFLYVDNANSVFFKWFDARYLGKGVSVVSSNDGISLPVPPEEEKRDLGVHFERLAGSPKLKANVAYRILRKD